VAVEALAAPIPDALHQHRGGAAMSSAQHPRNDYDSQHLLMKAVREIALAAKVPLAQLKALKQGAAQLAIPIQHGFIGQAHIYDRLIEQADNVGLIAEVGQEAVEIAIASAIKDGGNNIFPETVTPPPLEYVDISKWINAPVPQRRWAVLNRIPAKNVTVLSGTGGTGKTIIASSPP
jgi:AAA domain